MRTIIGKLSILTISQVLLWGLMPGSSRAVAPSDPDGDWPYSVEVTAEETVKGNPLDDGDDVYGLRGTYRFNSGDWGLEAGLGFANPGSDFVRSLGTGAELLLFDVSAVWYVNYRQQQRIWDSGSAIKPEIIFFAGPGLASLKIDDPTSVAALDESEVFFTLNAGIGAKLHLFRTKTYPAGVDDRDWNRRTSRWYLRPEIRARWFHGANSEVDWTAGVGLGYSFGNRPSRLSLDLKVREMSREISRTYGPEESFTAPEGFCRVIRQRPVCDDLEKYQDHLESLRSQVIRCGHKCRAALSNVNRCGSYLDDVSSRCGESYLPQ